MHIVEIHASIINKSFTLYLMTSFQSVIHIFTTSVFSVYSNVVFAIVFLIISLLSVPAISLVVSSQINIRFMAGELCVQTVIC